jgi:3',5'-cyclic AMP phosphodiesterase CpdA
VIFAHLSDLHLRDEVDAIELGRQLDRIVSRKVDHLVITGDLLDRWQPALLDLVLDALGERGLLSADRVTILHGNHDLASSGGHPRHRRDLLRVALRFWDPPPLVTMRRARFYRRVEARAPGAAAWGPFVKRLTGGVVLAVIDTVPAPWRPCSIRGREISLNHARGAVGRTQTGWLSHLPPGNPLIVLTHHYPLPISPYEWQKPAADRRSWLDRWRVVVPMEIREDDRERFWSAAQAAGATAVLCGHVHRARVEHYRGIAVGLNGQSGAEWAGRTIAFYRIERGLLEAEYESMVMGGG